MRLPTGVVTKCGLLFLGVEFFISSIDLMPVQVYECLTLLGVYSDSGESGGAWVALLVVSSKQMPSE